MKLKSSSASPALTAAGLLALAVLAPAQTTDFTYQGRLLQAGVAANGSYDLIFRLHNAQSGGSQIGSDVSRGAVPVSNGLFSVLVGFGAGAFDGQPRWLSISVRSNGAAGGYTALTNRQPVSPAPFALFASSAGGAPWSGLTGVPAGFQDGVDNDTRYAATTGLTLSGTNFGLDTNFADARFWRTTGNTGTVAGSNFLGTTDNQALEFKVAGQRALRLEPNAAGPNVLAGHPSNTVAAGAWGGAIGGGAFNTNAGPFATVPGGERNVAGTNSLAAGRRAKATHTGAFVWADATDADFASTASDQFLIRASGGVGIGTNRPAGAALHVAGNTLVGGTLQVASNTVLARGLSVSNDLSVRGRSFLTNGLVALGDAQITGPLVVSSNATVTGHSFLNGSALIGKTLILSNTVVAPVQGATLNASSSYLRLAPATPVTLSTTTAIADGPAVGAVLILEVVSQAVTIPHNANTKLYATGALQLTANQTLTLLWNGSDWIELAYSFNYP